MEVEFFNENSELIQKSLSTVVVFFLVHEKMARFIIMILQ